MKPSQPFSRRRFLRTVVVSAGAASLGPSMLGCDGEPARPTAEVFPQSVASGDPRNTSIVLWTRALPLDTTTSATVRLELGRDPEMMTLVELDLTELTASPDHDHCVRVKVEGLEEGTTYFYRFEHEGTPSNVGRFRTAENAGANIPVHFAVLSCQDYSGRYYNTLTRLLEEEYDNMTFVLHLGDYIYETTGDPGFMMTAPNRLVTLSEPGEAIALGDGADTFYAAQSVGNYRDIYRTYRSDPLLQQLHEKFPFIVTWDDHEFSDDSWGANATYSDGAAEELAMDRKLNSEQVWLEYMPVARDLDAASGPLSVDRGTLYPNNRIYRSFRFGRHCTLAVTDYRSYRPDHPIPEDAYPGFIALDQAQTQATLMRLETDGEIPDAAMAFASLPFRPYVDLDDSAYADERMALELLLTGGYTEAGVEPARAATLAAQYAQGLVDAAVLVATIDAGRAALPAALMNAGMFDPADPTFPRGVSFAMAGKTGLVGQLGSRYLVVKLPYDLIQTYRARVQGDTAFDDALGAEQEAWLRQTIADADTTWKVIGNSVCNTSHLVDLGPFAAQLPPSIPATRFYLNVDEWDGFPERRRKLMDELYTPNNVILLAGDIHGAYATEFDVDAEENRAIELTTSSVSSGPFADLLRATASRIPGVDTAVLDGLIGGVDGILMGTNEPRLKHSRSDVNGVMVVRLNDAEMEVDFHQLAGSVALPRNIGAPAGTPENYYGDPESLSDQWEVARFRSTKIGGKNGPLIPRSE